MILTLITLVLVANCTLDKIITDFSFVVQTVYMYFSFLLWLPEYIFDLHEHEDNCLLRMMFVKTKEMYKRFNIFVLYKAICKCFCKFCTGTE